MFNPLSLEDLQARFPRTLTDAETVTALAYLDDAWEEAVSRVPGIEARLTDGSLRLGLIIKALIPAVKAVMLNQDGYLEEAIDDWRGRRDAVTSTGRLFLSDEDLAILQVSGVAGGAFEIVLAS